MKRLILVFTLFACASLVHALSPMPDLTATGAIASLKADPDSSPVYGRTYNLGPTGLRGWIYIDRDEYDYREVGPEGLITGPSRQILVTVVGNSTPAAGVLAVDDVILGVGWGAGTTAIPAFTSDARKSFGQAIGEAEKSENGGIFRLRRWRAGVTTDVSITLPVMGTYTNTAPYSCPKSSAVLAQARNQLVGQLLADPSFLVGDYTGAVNALALLGGVAPGDPNFAAVQTRLQTYARSMATAGPFTQYLSVWHWAYINLFLTEYYLSTGDVQVLVGIDQYALKLAQSQSAFGTFGHNPSAFRLDGSGKRSAPGYGPVNGVGIPANIAIVMSKIALEAAGRPVNPEIATAVDLGSNYFASYTNRGSIPYGEHMPGLLGHASNGKDSMCAVLFGLQSGRTAAAEYFTRMSVAGFTGREVGHTGQGFSYLWGALGSNVGGALATSEYLKNIRWHLDLSRRSDGSFTYDGEEQYDAGITSDGTYLGESAYHGLSPTASYILTYALPLQRLRITGKNANPANILSSNKLTNAMAAATYRRDCKGYDVPRLTNDLREYDPVVRNYAIIELAGRSLSNTQLTTLRTMISGTNANGRASACQVLGLRRDSTALPLIMGRLNKVTEPDQLVRGLAAKALRSYTSDTLSTQRDAMLTEFIANAPSPTSIDWSDPLQSSNGNLSQALFGNAVPDGAPGSNIKTSTVAATKNLLYPAVRAGLRHPDSYPRYGVGAFCVDILPLGDVQAMIKDVYRLIQSESEVDRMWDGDCRASGIKTLQKWKIKEGIPLALGMLEVVNASENSLFWLNSNYRQPAFDALVSYGDAARWTLPTLKGLLNTWNPARGFNDELTDTINSIESAITAPAMIDGSAVANPQVVVTTGAKAIILTGSSPRTAVTFTNVTAPAHGTLTGTAPNLTYTPTAGYTGPDFFTFQTIDDQTTSPPGTVSIIVGTAGTGLKGEYFDDMNFTNLKLTRTDAQVNFDWGTSSPNAALGADTFSVRWSGLLLVPETGIYTFSTLNSDGVRLYINGRLIINDYKTQTTQWTDGTPVNLIKGQMVDIYMEYFDNTGPAVARLKWSGPSLAGLNGTIIDKEWLFDGTGVADRTAYAYGQSVTTSQNTAQAITLGGSGGSLTYSIVTPPANGTLSGTAPNLTYTPNANFIGTDSFTFRVSNSTGNSTTTTVSVDIWAGQPVDFDWASAISGTMSTAARWTPATAPIATGAAFYNFNFNQSGIYTVTHDLNNGFQLSQVNVAAGVTFAGGNSLAFVANGPLFPQLNQNSDNPVTFNTPLSLSTTTTLGGSGNGEVTLAGIVSGAGGLTKSSNGKLTLTAANTYTGQTTVTGGTLSFMGSSGNLSASSALTVATGGHLWFQPIGDNGTYNYNNFALNLAGQGADNNGSLRTVFFGDKNFNTYNLGGNVTVAGGVQFATYGIFNKINLGGTFTGVGDMSFVSDGAWFNDFVFSGDSSATGYAGTFKFYSQEAGMNAKLSGGNNRLPITARVDLDPIYSRIVALDLNGNSQQLSGLIVSRNALSAWVKNSGVGMPTLTINNAGPNTFAGRLGHEGTGFALTKLGAGILSLTGVNTYTGDTSVNGGVLAVNGLSIADTNKLIISGGKVDLTNTETVNTLFFSGIQQAPGVYTKDHLSGNFVGNGTLIVSTGPYVYTSWAGSHLSAGNGGSTGDNDKDGVPNLVEYALANGRENAALVGDTLTFTKRGAPWCSDIVYEIETSTTLAPGSWVPANGHVTVTSTSSSISCDMGRSSLQRRFFRLKVVQLDN